MPADTESPPLTRTLIPKMVHLGVSDADRAARFFGEVLEWQTERVEYRGHVRHYVLGDFAVRPCITDEPGAPPVQLGFEVADVAASVARVLGAGGRIVVDDVEETGRFVAARDDQDVALAFWNYGPPSPPPLGGWPPVGGLAYFAIHVPDVERGIEFYGRVLDWTFEDPEPADYRHVADHVEPVAMGIRGDARPGIWLYFIVRDLDAAVASIRALGGEVLDRSRTGPMDTVECRDDQGLSFRIAIPAP